MKDSGNACEIFGVMKSFMFSQPLVEPWFCTSMYSALVSDMSAMLLNDLSPTHGGSISKGYFSGMLVTSLDANPIF